MAGSFRIALVLLALAGAACVDLTQPTFVEDVPEEDAGADVVVVEDAPIFPDVPVQPSDGADEDTAPEDGGVDATLLPTGAACVRGSDCASKLCIDDVCCAAICTGTCTACNVAGHQGTCTPIPAGEDPAQECAMEAVATCGLNGTCDGAGACARYPANTECLAGSCTGSMETPASLCDASGVCRAQASRACPGGALCQSGSCAASCTQDSQCQGGFYCQLSGATGTCRTKLAIGATCARAAQCMTGQCVDTVCCGSPCTEMCSACNLADSRGTCKAVPAGTDPGNECAVEAGNVCGLDGTCNGAGACRRPSGIPCGGTSCSNNAEAQMGSCNGAGTCLPGPMRDCGAYACAGDRCATTCTSDLQCAPSYACGGGTCNQLPGPVLYWKMDEASGNVAIDESGNGHNGVYTGSGGSLPPPSTTMLPPLAFSNAAVRGFVRGSRHAVQTGMPSLLKPANDVSISMWYRASNTDVNGSELLSGQDAYILRMHADLPSGVGGAGFEVTKNTLGGHRQCFQRAARALDGNWHHVAAVITASALVAYFDGAPLPACAGSGAMSYVRSDLWVGRHGGGSNDAYDFEGFIDEVRVYNRALSAAEVARLASGKP